MANFGLSYGARVAITITIDALASNGQRQCTPIDWTGILYEDAEIFLIIVTGATVGGTAANNYVNCYAFGSDNNATPNYTDNAGAADAAITLPSSPNMVRIGVGNCPVASTTYKIGPFSVGKAFDGVMPPAWGIVIENKTGGALGTGNVASYMPVRGTY